MRRSSSWLRFAQYWDEYTHRHANVIIAPNNKYGVIK